MNTLLCCMTLIKYFASLTYAHATLRAHNNSATDDMQVQLSVLGAMMVRIEQHMQAGPTDQTLLHGMHLAAAATVAIRSQHHSPTLQGTCHLRVAWQQQPQQQQQRHSGDVASSSSSSTAQRAGGSQQQASTMSLTLTAVALTPAAVMLQ
jgi:hypothetical protein